MGKSLSENDRAVLRNAHSLSKSGRSKYLQPLTKRGRNRLLYGLSLLTALGLTWMYGGRMMYVFLYTLLMLPVFSYVITFVLLRGLRVTQSCAFDTLIKGEPGLYRVTLQNRTPLIYDDVHCLFIDDHFAVETDDRREIFFVKPFMRTVHEVSFRVKYRGVYALGLRVLQVNDMLGLFTLRRRLKDSLHLTVLPRVLDLAYFPLAMNLLSHSHAQVEIKDEDYSVVSDIRPYVPTDSIKRVHWKLTAKRQQWMVKTYQSNALNRITILLDTARRGHNAEEMLALEDRMIETVLAVARYCLRRQMPVALTVNGGIRETGRLLGDFDSLYSMAAGLAFETTETHLALTLLNQCLEESSSYLNVVVATARLDAAFYERVVTANYTGHFVSVLYFALDTPEAASEELYNRLVEGGAVCYRVTEGTELYAQA